MGPTTFSVFQPSREGTLGTRPGDVRKPTTEQKLAGLRSEPPRSLPSAIGSIPQASATAAPPLEPPQVFDRSQGFRVRPKIGIERLRSRAEFRRVGFADGDGARALRSLDQQRAEIRHIVLENRRPEGGAQAAGLGQILERDRKAVQRAQEFAARRSFIRAQSLRPGVFLR